MALRELQIRSDMAPSENIDIHSLTGVRLCAFWVLDKAGGEKNDFQQLRLPDQ